MLIRCWVWRQGIATLIQPSTTAAEFNVDGLPPVPVSEVKDACREIATLTERFYGGHTRWEVLSAEHPRMTLNDKPG